MSTYEDFFSMSTNFTEKNTEYESIMILALGKDITYCLTCPKRVNKVNNHCFNTCKRAKSPQ